MHDEHTSCVVDFNEFIGWLVIDVWDIFWSQEQCFFRRKKNYKMKYLRYSLFWDVMQCGLVVSYRHFGTTCRSTLQRSSSPRPRKNLRVEENCWEKRRKEDVLKKTMKYSDILQFRYFPNFILQLSCCIISASYFVSRPVQRNLLRPYISTTWNTWYSYVKFGWEIGMRSGMWGMNVVFVYSKAKFSMKGIRNSTT